MNKRKFISGLTVGLVLFILSCEQSDPVEKKATLIWSDEFDGTELNSEKWEVQLGDGSQYGIWAWGNNEKQYYKKENILIEEGKLKIKAVYEENNGYNYSSARIRSMDRGDFQYGRIEASIRMDNTPGLWHAFWMLPTSPSSSWPISGEIDIMEYVGNSPNQILNYVHFADVYENHLSKGEGYTISQDDKFHQYAIEWDENQIIWYRDSIETFKILRDDDELGPTWPFDSKFHILLNTAVGGNLGGEIDELAMKESKFMEVEYVRVYQ